MNTKIGKMDMEKHLENIETFMRVHGRNVTQCHSNKI